MLVGGAKWVGWGTYHDGNPRRDEAGHALSGAVERADAVVLTDEIAAYRGLGRSDFLMLRPYNPRQGVPAEFTLYRDVVPAVTTEESPRRVMARNRAGLAFVDTRLIHREWMGIRGLVPFLADEMESLAVPPALRIQIYRGELVDQPDDAAACAGLARRTD